MNEEEQQLPVLLVVSHGDLARAVLDSARMILGPIEGSEAVSLPPSGSVDQLEAEVGEKLKLLGEDRPALVLVDLFGGSCCNVAAKFIARRENVRVISGLNIAMVIEFATARTHLSFADLAGKVMSAGCKAIIDVNKLFAPKTED